MFGRLIKQTLLLLLCSPQFYPRPLGGIYGTLSTHKVKWATTRRPHKLCPISGRQCAISTKLSDCSQPADLFPNMISQQFRRSSNSWLTLERRNFSTLPPPSLWLWGRYRGYAHLITCQQVSISSPLTQMVYLLLFLSDLTVSKSIYTRPSIRPGYN